MTYPEAVSFLESLPMFTKKNAPSDVARIMELLGNPEQSFRLIHVAGTNGKGSTCAYLESIFRGMGIRTGLFTSPHLVRINERIRVDGEMIPDDAFADALLRVRQAVERWKEEGGRELSYFETLFVMGLCHFQKSRIQLLICETGLGGRLDATNTVASADCVVITSVSLDHTKYLGETVEEIAYEKAGIIRLNTPVVYCAKDARSAGVIERVAKERNAERIPLTPDMFCAAGQEGSLCVRLTLKDGSVLPVTVPFEAQVQAENACLAALCALRLGAGKDAVRYGIARTVWPGRMDRIRPDVYIDGAHNPDGIRQIAVEIRRIAKKNQVWLLTSIVSDKNHAAMVQELCRGVRYAGIIITSVGGSRQLDAQTLAQEFLNAGQKRVETEPDAGKAYQRALQEKGESVLFCVGSLYLVGEILSVEPLGRTEDN